MRDDKFKIQFSEAYVEALNRRHNGRKLSKTLILMYKDRLDLAYSDYQKASKSLDRLYKFWDEKEVESHFMQPIWYNAHSRLKKYRKAQEEAHRSLFYTLLEADGNTEDFNPNCCISAEEIKADFYAKYINKKQLTI